MRVDVHAHCYPPQYLEELRRAGFDEKGGIGLMMVPWTSAEKRIESLDKLGIAVQFLSLSTPGVYFADEGLSRALAGMSNEFIAGVCRSVPARFMSFASLPLPNIRDALDELDRALGELGMDGVLLGTNIRGRPLADDALMPLYEELNRRKARVLLHPMVPAYNEMMPAPYLAYGIPFSVAFLFETCMAVTQMAFKGVFERFPEIFFILPHSGGAIPFIYPRIDVGYETRPPGHPMRGIPHSPGYYFKRLYYETAFSYSPESVRCTLALAGADRLLFGTDYPYCFGPFAKRAVESIEELSVPVEQREKVFFRNAVTLFPGLAGKLGLDA